MEKGTEFLFYNELDQSNDILCQSALTRRLVSFATAFGLEGNIWQQWLAYKIMISENEFSLACERREVREDSTLLKLAADDISRFTELMEMRPSEEMCEYVPPYADSCMTAQGRRIAEFSGTLAGAENEQDFLNAVVEEYKRYGTGIYGLYRAFRVADRVSADDGFRLIPIAETSDVSFDDLIGYETQKQTLRANTEAFLNGEAANNVLLYGDSGTGKSTSIHALMHDYFDRGLRLIEIAKHQRSMLPQVLSEAKKRNYKYIIFLDDLSFEENESDYKELKAMLEGALEAREDSVLIYATSNRRHLIRETWRDRNDMEYEEDIHRSDTMEEKLSLAARFGVMIYYPKPDPKEYLNIVRLLAERKGIELSGKELDDEARKWELRHGGMSGRTANQFITWLGGTE